MFRKGSKALGNTLVTSTNENDRCLQVDSQCLQMNSQLGMRRSWHGSKVGMSLALKRKLCVLGRKKGCPGKGGKVLQVDLANREGRERRGWLECFFRQLDSDFVKCQSNLAEEGKWGRTVNSARNCWVFASKRGSLLSRCGLFVGQKRPHFIAAGNYPFPRNPNGLYPIWSSFSLPFSSPPLNFPILVKFPLSICTKSGILGAQDPPFPQLFSGRLNSQLFFFFFPSSFPGQI